MLFVIRYKIVGDYLVAFYPGEYEAVTHRLIAVKNLRNSDFKLKHRRNSEGILSVSS